MKIKRRLSIVTAVAIALLLSGVAVAGTVYFYILPTSTSGHYTGPGLPNPGMSTPYSISVSGYGNWTTFGFHSNTTQFWVNTTVTGISGSYQHVAFGLMNQSDYDGLNSNSSMQWVRTYNVGIGVNWKLDLPVGNYYLVWIQEGTGGYSESGWLTLTPY